MRNRISYGRWLIVLFLAAAFLSPAAALATNKGIEVSYRVDPNTISVLITSDGDVDYGALALGATQDTVTLIDTQTAQNNGDEAAKFRIKSSNASGGTAWTLAANTGSLNEFTHEFSITGGAPWTAMTVAGTYYDLVASVAASASQTFDLQFGMPTLATDLGVHTITVTILAVAP